MIYELCIIGGGAIGGILTYYLFRGGLTDIIVYYGSRESVESISREGGLNIVYGGKEYFVPINPRYYKEPYGKCEYLINAVKAYNVPDTIDLMKKISLLDTLILMIQNGFGSLEYVEERFKNLGVAGGVVFIGAERVSRTKIVYHGGETIFAGCRRNICSKLFELAHYFKRGGCDFRLTCDLDFYRWIKMAVNSVINPLTAIARAKNNIVLSRPGIELAEMILSELVIVAKKYGYNLDREKLLNIVLRNARNTSENYSSMVQDVLRGRKTEIDYINGFIARELGREDSINNIITKIIHLIEELI